MAEASFSLGDLHVLHPALRLPLEASGTWTWCTWITEWFSSFRGNYQKCRPYSGIREISSARTWRTFIGMGSCLCPGLVCERHSQHPREESIGRQISGRLTRASFHNGSISTRGWIALFHNELPAPRSLQHILCLFSQILQERFSHLFIGRMWAHLWFCGSARGRILHWFSLYVPMLLLKEGRELPFHVMTVLGKNTSPNKSLCHVSTGCAQEPWRNPFSPQRPCVRLGKM